MAEWWSDDHISILPPLGNFLLWKNESHDWNFTDDR